MFVVQNSQFKIVTEGKGKARTFRSRFIEPGLVNYENEGIGQVLLKKESIDKFIGTMVGCPVVISHVVVSDSNVKEVAVGFVSEVYYNVEDGWYWCKGVITNPEAKDLIESGISVSCTYKFKEVDQTGGNWHDNAYDKEVLDGEFLHLALVPNPRYGDATIVLNATARKEKMFGLFKKKGEPKMDEVKNSTAAEKLVALYKKALDGSNLPEGVTVDNCVAEFTEVMNSSFKESDHPRDKSGKFTESGNGGEGSDEEYTGYNRYDFVPQFDSNKELMGWHVIDRAKGDHPSIKTFSKKERDLAKKEAEKLQSQWAKKKDEEIDAKNESKKDEKSDELKNASDETKEGNTSDEAPAEETKAPEAENKSAPEANPAEDKTVENASVTDTKSDDVEVDNKSFEEIRKASSSVNAPVESGYKTREERIKLGNKLF